MPHAMASLQQPTCAPSAQQAGTPKQRAVGSSRRHGIKAPRATTSRVAEEFESQARSVELIISDVDGTLLNEQQQLTPGVRAAAVAAAAAGVPLIVATGKAMGPWRDVVLPHIGSRMPQVYLQGLLINCPDDGIILQRQLLEHIILEAIEFADCHGITLTAYCGDRIVCRETDEQSDRLLFYKEPTPEGIGPLEPHIGRLPIIKLLLMGSAQRILELRPAAELQFGGRASLTTAIPGMLELLPLGTSKGAGVGWLLERLGVDPAACMALGDGENDVEMLRLVGLGVAMGNAGPPALAAADVITATNDEDGVARAIERFVLKPRGLL